MDNIKKEIASEWNIWAKGYDKQYSHGLKSEEEKVQWKVFLSEVIGKESKKILDVGTGTGFLALLLAELGHNCTGLDISEGMMEVARKKAKEAKLNINFGMGDAENLPCKDNTYDIVVNRHLLWTIPHPEKALSEWIRVLKPGGKLVIIDGDWFYKNSSYEIQKFLGKILIALTEFRNPWNNDGDYSDSIKEKLPMIKDENARNVQELVRNTELSDVKVIPMEEVDRVEKAVMPLKNRLMNPYKRICIMGIKK
ncbi:methyltransferase type 11 [Clostridium carboxidivorans P7]|uniref:Methyltransferase type 11 n=1 Tax=Clostridium carboxidivorans P7 TaxID=536227 RepID=C6PRH7_9CLOT|nr:methyltransferase domain-containing protein [Clostridium carboxidivorans]AKN31488.1 methyltransferase type 11 [Clostridium carboxidivorans P7]EET88158.1 Methyltransferase type 11 [Clostridium carboxidivorans P7]EFG87114.1 methyltransferase domain protein [Clostridium carboxidivorans P7]